MPLTKGFSTVVDHEDLPMLQKYEWLAIKRRHTWYAGRWVQKNYKQTLVLMHRLIMRAGDTQMVDHEDGNGLNNVRRNLRLASPSANAANGRKRNFTTASQFKGVIRPQGRTKWQAAITVNYRRIHLGCFGSEIEAAHAYDKAARKYFGEFACVNFPTCNEQSAIAPTSFPRENYL